MAGVAAGLREITEVDRRLMREAGITWLRSGNLGFDPGRALRAEPQPERYEAVKRAMCELRCHGFRFIGITPLPKEMQDVGGAPGSPAQYEAYRRVCAWLATDLDGVVDLWQVANELDIWIFRHTLTLEQSVDFLKAGLAGIKESGPGRKAGINITLFPSRPGEVDGNTERNEGEFIARAIYGDPGVAVDYAGFDSYPGTWREGGAESWSDYLDRFHVLTGKPVIIQEFGYSSAGGLMTEAEKRKGLYPCQAKKWRYAWRGAHTPGIQAQFIEESFRVFVSKPYVAGAIYYRWKDAKLCWQCKQADCPAETAWGLLDADGRINPSYHSLKASLADLRR